MRKITITEALNELKLYDSKINKAITSATLVGAAKKSSDMIGHMKKSTFVANAKSSYQQITDLIRNRNAIKSAIVKSNALTQINIAGKTMTVAEAIERKSSIEYELGLLAMMNNQYASATATFDRENRKVDAKVDELLVTLVGKDSDKKLSEDDINAVSKPYREKNEYELVDPLDIHSLIEKYDEETQGFLASVDTQLSISNSVTYIEVEF